MSQKKAVQVWRPLFRVCFGQGIIFGGYTFFTPGTQLWAAALSGVLLWVGAIWGWE